MSGDLHSGGSRRRDRRLDDTSRASVAVRDGEANGQHRRAWLLEGPLILRAGVRREGAAVLRGHVRWI